MSNLAKAIFHVDRKLTYDHLVYVSINTIKYRNDSLGGWIVPAISRCILYKKNYENSKSTLYDDGLTINFSYLQALQNLLFDNKFSNPSTNVHQNFQQWSYFIRLMQLYKYEKFDIIELLNQAMLIALTVIIMSLSPILIIYNAIIDKVT